MCLPPVFEYLRVKSLEFIILVRKEYSYEKVDFSMNLLSNLADKYGIALGFCVANVVLSPVNGQILLAAGSLSVSFNILAKMLVRDARPYFYSGEYIPVSCDFEYGSPSGHAQSATSFFLTFLTLIRREYHITKYKKTSYAIVTLC